MLTGISGSNTVESCSTICGLSSSVLTGSGSIGGAGSFGEAADGPVCAAGPGAVSALVSNMDDAGGPYGDGGAGIGGAWGGRTAGGGGAAPATCGGMTD